MRLILNRDDLVKILQEDEEIRDLIRKLALGQPEEGEAHEVPESLKESEVPKAPMEASLSPKKQELRKELEATRKDRDYWQQEASQVATERDDAVRDCQGALNERDQALDQRNQAVQERDEAVREKNGALRAMAEAEQQREQAVLAMKDADRKIDEARRIVSGLQSERDFLQERLDEAKAGIGALTADLDRVKAEREALKNSLQQAEQALAQRFDEGWKLYEAYQELDDYFKDLLDGVLARPGFEAFIVGLSQDRTLQTLWDVTREAVMKSRDDAAGELLWHLFRYSLDLVNQSRSEDLYVIEDVAVGDFYDIDKHILTSGSRTQGCLSKVFLPGYRNISTGKIVCKSQVKI